MTSSRQEILARITAAIADRPPVPDNPHDDPEVSRPSSGEGGAPARGDIVARFVQRVADYRAVVRAVPQAEAPAAVAAAIAERGARRIVVPTGLTGSWLANLGTGDDRGTALELLHDDPPLTVRQLDEADGVVTGCAVAIAETGTIVLDAGRGQGRRALTLLPDYHLCVVRAEQIEATVAGALGRLDPTRPQTWISGPSATSDIELNRVEGVHGPRTLHVIVIVPEGDGGT